MKKSTLVALAAAVLSAKLAGAASFSGEEVDRLEALIDQQDFVGIQTFATQRVDLPEGDPLAELLRAIQRDTTVAGAGTELTWNFNRRPDRLNRRPNLQRGALAWHWRPPHHVIRKLYGKPGHRPKIY